MLWHVIVFIEKKKSYFSMLFGHTEKGSIGCSLHQKIIILLDVIFFAKKCHTIACFCYFLPKIVVLKVILQHEWMYYCMCLHSCGHGWNVLNAFCPTVHILPDKPMSRKPTEVITENCKYTGRSRSRPSVFCDLRSRWTCQCSERQLFVLNSYIYPYIV